MMGRVIILIVLIIIYLFILVFFPNKRISDQDDYSFSLDNILGNQYERKKYITRLGKNPFLLLLHLIILSWLPFIFLIQFLLVMINFPILIYQIFSKPVYSFPPFKMTYS